MIKSFTSQCVAFGLAATVTFSLLAGVNALAHIEHAEPGVLAQQTATQPQV